ncbi:hypothetical protein ACWGLF_29035 [Streptomyces puniciscabiei]
MHAALATYCVDISEPKTLRGLMPAYRLYTARWSPADLHPTAARRPPTTAQDRRLPAGAGTPATPRPSDLGPGEWEIPRAPLRYERAALAGTVLREKLHHRRRRGGASVPVAKRAVEFGVRRRVRRGVWGTGR